MMQFFYENVDVLQEGTKLNACVMHDRAGGEADGLTAVFADPTGKWATWNPQRGDRVRLVDGDFDSGVLYVDDPRISGGFFRLEAVSVPPTIRQPRTKVWRDVRLSEIISDMAGQAELAFQTYSIQDYHYNAISQRAETDMAFLARVCLREGYAVKVTDGALVVFSEQALESASPQATVDRTQTAPEQDFQAGVGLLSSSQVRYFNIQESRQISQTVTDPAITGGASRRNEYCSTDGEAQRWAYGYLRAANKRAHTGRIQLLQQSAFAAGSTVNLTGFSGENNGAWFVYGVDQDAVNARTTLLLRRPLDY